jgi:apolipoprotein D and lipocalin family protein
MMNRPFPAATRLAAFWFRCGLRRARLATPQLLALLMAGAAHAHAASPDAKLVPLAALPSLNVPAYMGTWYQVAWFPNRFQKQCVSDTAAVYRQLPGGQVEVTNRCKREDGSHDSVVGLARPAGSVLRADRLEPAQLEVSFLPPMLRWLPIWGSYWVVDLAPDGRYAVVSEPSRNYLWVLARQPQLKAADETAIRSRLSAWGFDLNRWAAHPHSAQASQALDTGASWALTHDVQALCCAMCLGGAYAPAAAVVACE